MIDLSFLNVFPDIDRYKNYQDQGYVTKCFALKIRVFVYDSFVTHFISVILIQVKV